MLLGIDPGWSCGVHNSSVGRTERPTPQMRKVRADCSLSGFGIFATLQGKLLPHASIVTHDVVGAILPLAESDRDLLVWMQISLLPFFFARPIDFDSSAGQVVVKKGATGE